MVHVDSRSRLIPLTSGTLTMLAVILSAFGLALLVARANVTNLMLARGSAANGRSPCGLPLARAAGVSYGNSSSRADACRTGCCRRARTDDRDCADLSCAHPRDVSSWHRASGDGAGAVQSGLARALRAGHCGRCLSGHREPGACGAGHARESRRAARGEGALDAQRSHLRTGLVAMQIGACVMFLICAIGLIDESRRLANPDRGLSDERVAEVRIASLCAGKLPSVSRRIR